MMKRRSGRMTLAALVALGVSGVAFEGCNLGRMAQTSAPEPIVVAHQKGDPASGRQVFRFETFGNEGFWTDAMRLPQGMVAAKLTPMKALEAGVSIDAEAVPPAMQRALAAELKTDRSTANAPMLHDPKTTIALLNANAVIGVVAVDSNRDGKIDVMAGDKVGIACAICHTITDGSVFQMPNGGSVGRRIDGPASLTLNMGEMLAMAANSRAYYPNLQLELGGKTIGRAPRGLTKDSSEGDVDAYLRNPKFYPVGTFDDTQDGHGNSVVNTPLFRTDLSAPWGSAGEHNRLDNIGNASYTTNLDPTTLVTPEGRRFLAMVGGAAGKEMADNYAQILKETGVTGFPFVRASTGHKVGDPASPVGRRVDNKKLLDMNAYLDSLQAPRGARVDAGASARGRETFQVNCTTCHNVDQRQPVRPVLIDLKTLWPAYSPTVLAQRQPPLSPIQDSPGTFDDKMIVVDASMHGQKRGNALPLLLDLARKQVFLHDASVSGLEMLLDPTRGATAPHPFYVVDRAKRADVVEFLRGLDTTASVLR